MFEANRYITSQEDLGRFKDGVESITNTKI
jgi:hypothetical protein